MARVNKSSVSKAANFSFLNRENIINYTRIQEAQFEEYCNLYGVNLQYFSRSMDFYLPNGRIKQILVPNPDPTTAVEKPVIFNKTLRDFTYFNGPETLSFGFQMPLKGYLHYASDTFMFSGFGMDTTSDATLYITKKSFSEQCKQFFGKPSELAVNLTYNTKIKKWKNAITNEFKIPFEVNDHTKYNVIVQFPEFDDLTNGAIIPATNIIKGFDFPVSSINPEYSTTVSSNHFIEIEENSISCTLSNVSVTAKGNGSATINLSFTIYYNDFEPPATDQAHYTTLDTVINQQTVPVTFAPKVGDIIRLPLITTPNDATQFRDYTITYVNDTNLSKDSISPFLGAYIWECTVTRRKPSHEDLPDTLGGLETNQMEKGIETVLNKTEQNIAQDITREEAVYDYTEEYDDVLGLLNIDMEKDGIFGSLGTTKRREGEVD